MKKILISAFVLAGLFTFTGPVHADVQCGNPANNTLTTTYMPCEAANPENVPSAWGVNASVPAVAPGVTVADEGGVPSTCPTWFSKNCVDITHTTYYRNQMLTIGQQLKTLGFTGGTFGYWINLAK